MQMTDSGVSVTDNINMLFRRVRMAVQFHISVFEERIMVYRAAAYAEGRYFWRGQ